MFTPRLTTGKDHAEQFEREFPEETRLHLLAQGDWRGPTFFWNMQEKFHSWTRVVEIYTEYKAVPEFWPPQYQAETEYWEIVPADHEGMTLFPRDHIGSWSTEEETKRHLVRLRQAQHRARHILLMKQLQEAGRVPAAEYMKRRIFAYPDHLFDLGQPLYPRKPCLWATRPLTAPDAQPGPLGS